MIRYDPTLEQLTSNFFVLCTNTGIYYLALLHLSISMTMFKIKYLTMHKAQIHAGAKGKLFKF